MALSSSTFTDIGGAVSDLFAASADRTRHAPAVRRGSPGNQPNNNQGVGAR
jgi:hypothetical protein